VLGGKASPSAGDITAILSSGTMRRLTKLPSISNRLADLSPSDVLAVGAEADSAKIEQLLSELSGKELAAVIAAGTSKLASVPSGGGGGGAAPAAAAGGAAPAKEEKKKEEEKEEPEEVRRVFREVEG
jgi:ribosomal protein L12E/L44/L45/RPP1/RPP2